LWLGFTAVHYWRVPVALKLPEYGLEIWADEPTAFNWRACQWVHITVQTSADTLFINNTAYPAHTANPICLPPNQKIVVRAGEWLLHLGYSSQQALISFGLSLVLLPASMWLIWRQLHRDKVATYYLRDVQLMSGMFLCAFLLRVYFLYQPQPGLIYDNFFVSGLSLAQGNYQNAELIQRVQTWGPFYPLWIATLFRLSATTDFTVIRYGQAILSALLPVLLYGIGLQVQGRATGVIAGGLAAFYPALILYTGFIMSETLAITLLWASVLMLLWACNRASVGRVGAAGLLLLLTGLSRPTLLPIVLILSLSLLAGLRRVSLAKRIGLTGLGILIVVLGLWLWNVSFARLWPSAAAETLIGNQGLSFVLETLQQATHPSVRGWAPDDRSLIVTQQTWWQNALPTSGLQLSVSGLSLIFSHLMLPENFWKDTFALPAYGMMQLRMVINLLALGGLGIGLVRWRSMAAFWCLLAGFAATMIKWIEIRQTMPFEPLFFILAAMCVVAGWYALHHSAAARLVAVLSALFVVLFVTLHTSGNAILTRLPGGLSAFGLLMLGYGLEVTVIVLVLLAGYWVYRSHPPSLPARYGLLVCLMPGCLFLLLYGSFRLAPPFLTWQTGIWQPQQRASQRMTLAEPLEASQLVGAFLFVSQQHHAGTGFPQVTLNGTSIPTDWQAPFCAESALRLCTFYEQMSQMQSLTPADWKQWWVTAVNPAHLSGADEVTIELYWEGQADSLEWALNPVACESSVYAPSLTALAPGQTSSLYRFIALPDRWTDWRLLEQTPLASLCRYSAVDGVALPGQWHIYLQVDLANGERRYW
jgi:hypothetical protein